MHSIVSQRAQPEHMQLQLLHAMHLEALERGCQAAVYASDACVDVSCNSLERLTVQQHRNIACVGVVATFGALQAVRWGRSLQETRS
jgi:hypothetical protein